MAGTAPLVLDAFGTQDTDNTNISMVVEVSEISEFYRKRAKICSSSI